MSPMATLRWADAPAWLEAMDDDEGMHEEKAPERDSFWMTVRARPVPWFLFLATTLAAVILAWR
jgi:hypothetical protein